MYCPKCKQTFEEGSRRFCPTDGARLISDAVESRPAPGGVFANLLPKNEPVSEFDETLSDVPYFSITEAEPDFVEIQPERVPEIIEDEIFFDLDDDPATPRDEDFLQLDQPFEPAVEPSAALPPAARKVSQYDIPAGHIDLADRQRSAPYSVDFDEDDPESFVGRIVKGRYQVSEFLGGDEAGLAYLADDKIVGDKKVLVRVLLAEPADEIIRSILAEERVALSHFSHPNIARLVDSGQFANGLEFLVSEYVDALSVAEILAIHGQFPLPRAARVLRQASIALTEAHQEGILHRDLRPENIIIDASPGDVEQAKLVNFGASNGTPTLQNASYKSPEVLEGRIATNASDIFSLAVIAYEMLTGQVPFEGSSPKEIVRSQNAGRAILPSEIRPELSPAVDDILSRAISYDRADRYTKARELGEALFAALTAVSKEIVAEPQISPDEGATPIAAAKNQVRPKAPVTTSVAIPAAEVPAPTPASTKPVAEPAWKNRSPEPPAVESSRSKLLAVVGIMALLAILGVGWWYLVNRPEPIDVPSQAEHVTDTSVPTIVSNTEMPPLARTIPQPPNSNFYQNSKPNLKGDLLRNFVGFTMYYPKDWKVIGPQPSAAAGSRGKFVDISRTTADDRMQEQMLVGYYPSKGTFNADSESFQHLVKETNETLQKLLPGYQMISEGEIKLNGDWRAYEVKFQASAPTSSGEKLVVWGRRLFVPAARPGVRNGFEITMLATSFSEDVKGVDDVGVKGGLASVLYSFEPSQNF